MSKVIALECGCSLDLDEVELLPGYAHIGLYVNFCEEHEDVKLSVGSDWLRLEPIERALPDAEYGFVRDEGVLPCCT